MYEYIILFKIIYFLHTQNRKIYKLSLLYNNTMNKWKIISIVLFVFAIILSMNLYKQQTETYKFGDIEINKKTFQELDKALGENEFEFCDLEKDKCIHITKIKKFK